MTKTATARKRLKELGIKIGYLPSGALNSICDVAGIRVGHSTIIKGEGKVVAGHGPVRTGVTVIIPHDGDLWNDRPTAAFYSLNGCGVVSGSDWINECGALEGAIALTNTHSVGDVGKALTKILIEQHQTIGAADDAYLPVVGECDDSPLNDINGFHVTEEHVRQAMASASNKNTEEGSVGAGTGMTCYGYKGGIGTASRKVEIGGEAFTVGVLLNSNHGQVHQLLIDGVPVGRSLVKDQEAKKNKEGSIVIVVATDAALNQRQLERLSKRACLGLARTGAIAADGSGDFVIAFSTSRKIERKPKGNFHTLAEIDNGSINPLFEAVIECTEEAVLNSIFVADTMTGKDDFVVPGLPVERCLQIMGRR